MPTHDDDKSVFLDSKSSWVDIESKLSQRNSPSGQFFPGSTYGENQDLGNDITYRKWGLMLVNNCSKTSPNTTKTDISQAKKLIHSRKKDNKNGHQYPGSYGYNGRQPIFRSRVFFVNPLLQAMLGSSLFETQAATSGTIQMWVWTIFSHIWGFVRQGHTRGFVPINIPLQGLDRCDLR